MFRHGVVPVLEVRCAGQQIYEAGIEDLEDEYGMRSSHGGSDTLILKDDNGRVLKKIRWYNSEPISLWMAKNSIIGVKGRIYWEPDTPSDESAPGD